MDQQVGKSLGAGRSIGSGKIRTGSGKGTPQTKRDQVNLPNRQG